MENLENGYYPFDLLEKRRFLEKTHVSYPTIGHDSMDERFFYYLVRNNQGYLRDENVGQRWAKLHGKVTMKRENGLLKWIFASENDSSTLVVTADDYGLEEKMLRPLIYLRWEGSKILVKILS